jgi:hypothetical protein
MPKRRYEYERLIPAPIRAAQADMRALRLDRQEGRALVLSDAALALPDPNGQ